MTFRNRKLAVLAIAALGVAACGGSSGNGSGTTSAFARGSIQRFGSVVVNGVEWRTQGATLLTPDDSTTSRSLGSEAEIANLLEKGQIVSVKGKIDDDGRGGQATEIEFHKSVEGVVSSRDAAGFTVGGVKVSVDSSSEVYSGSGADDSYTSVTVGDRVSVSGVPDDKGGLRAGAVKIEDSTSSEIEVKGFVLAAPSGGTFSLSLTPGGPAFMIVNAAAATGLAAATAGAFVEVKGTSVTAGTPPTLTATLVKPEDDFQGGVNDEAEIEGIVSSGTLASFVVAGTTVTTSGATVYTGLPAGSSAEAEFALGVKVEAEGTLDANGTLAARKVKFKDGARMGGAPTAIGAAGFTLLGNQVVVIDGSTQVEGTVGAGTFVEVRGYRRADGTTYAQRVKASASGGGDRPFLQGIVEAAASPSLTVNGIAIQTSSATEFQDDTVSENEVRISQSAFFGLVKVGSIVKADWDQGTTDFAATPAREVELESEDD